MGLSLGMDLSKYGIDPDHIKEYFGGTDVSGFDEDFEDEEEEDFEADSSEDEESDIEEDEDEA